MPGVCPRCLREVYFAEEKLALGKVWHSFCFSCRNCRKLLDSWTVATHSGELYCRNCHDRLFPITSVRNPPAVGPVFTTDDARNFAVSPCESLNDCRCRCYCKEPDFIERRYGDERQGGSSASLGEHEGRIRGGGGREELEGDSPRGERGDDIEDSQLEDAQSFVTTLCDPPLSPGAVDAWYNRHQSASQSTFGRPTSARGPSGRPSSTPASGETSAGREADVRHFSGNRRPGSPCRLNHKHRGHWKPCHRHFCRDADKADKIVGPGGKFVKDYQAGNFVANYRNLLSDPDENLQDYRDPLRSSPSEASFADTEEDEETPNHLESPENNQEDFRLRGGCGGGSASGCCCSSSRTSPKFERQTPPCAKRHQPDRRGSTIEGACGCGARGRIGCGVAHMEINAGGFSDESNRGCCSESNDDDDGAACATSAGFRATGFETCPPGSADRCSPDPSNFSGCNTVACSPPCADRRGCCPPAGCRPVKRRTTRCDGDCRGDNRSCGGGGCCGGGCRGGCGKPGQICMPLGACAIPQRGSRTAAAGGGSPCRPPRRFSPAASCCGTPGGIERGGGAKCCRSPSPGGRSAGGGGCASPSRGCPPMDEERGCQPKVGNGCECLGGGLDCQRCGRKVYQAEMQIVSGVPYHNICFSCFCCRKPLETLTYHENCGEIYCKQCYVRNFGPQGYGYAGVLQTPM